MSSLASLTIWAIKAPYPDVGTAATVLSRRPTRTLLISCRYVIGFSSNNLAP